MNRELRYKQILKFTEAPRKLNELVENIDLAKSTVRQYLRELVDLNLLEKIKRGTYQRTEIAEKWIKGVEAEKEKEKETSLERDYPPEVDAFGTLVESLAQLDNLTLIRGVEIIGGSIVAATGASLFVERSHERSQWIGSICGLVGVGFMLHGVISGQGEAKEDLTPVYDVK